MLDCQPCVDQRQSGSVLGAKLAARVAESVYAADLKSAGPNRAVWVQVPSRAQFRKESEVNWTVSIPHGQVELVFLRVERIEPLAELV